MKCLNTTMTRPNCVNVIVTQTQLVASLTKVLLFGLAPTFDVENIYSAAKCGKNNLLEIYFKMIINHGSIIKKQCIFQLFRERSMF